MGFLTKERWRVNAILVHKMKIVIVGGSGFVGQGLLAELSQQTDVELVSVSRSGRPANLTAAWAEQVEWLAADILKDGPWQPIVAQSDWVIDAVGILLENRAKNRTYARLSVAPAQKIIDVIQKQQSSARFLFVSANAVPFFMKGYLQAKLTVEALLQAKLPDQHVVIYPGIVYHRARLSSFAPGLLLAFVQRLPIFGRLAKPWRAVSREHLGQAVVDIVHGQTSDLTKRLL